MSRKVNGFLTRATNRLGYITPYALSYLKAISTCIERDYPEIFPLYAKPKFELSPHTYVHENGIRTALGGVTLTWKKGSLGRYSWCVLNITGGIKEQSYRPFMNQRLYNTPGNLIFNPTAESVARLLTEYENFERVAEASQ
jgi:hypothetical protein